MTYSVAIKLLTQEFEKGARTVKDGFNSLQARIVTFATAISALDISVTGFVKSLIDVTRETGRAATVMKNVSATTSEYAENMRFATRMSQQYGVYVNDVVKNFAKFRGAAGASNMSLEDQRELFANVTKACSAFGLSTDETNGAFLALTQMMGKGKVQTEELRKQLGERIPVALQAMANAAGTTVAGLEDLLRSGKLIASEVLPAFGRELAAMTPEIDTDNIETALTRLQNAFKEFTDGVGIGDTIKKAVNTATSAVTTATNNIGNIVIGVVALISGAVANGLVKIWNNVQAAAVKIKANADTLQAKLTAATQKRVAAEQKLEQVRLKMAQATSAQLVKLKQQEAKAITALQKAITAESKAQDAARQASAVGATMNMTTAWGRMQAAVLVSVAKIKAALSSMWAAWGPMAIVSAIVAIIGKFVALKKELDEINNRLSNFRKGLEEAGKNTAAAINMQSYQNILNDSTVSIKDKVATAEAAATAMGKSGQKEGETTNDFIDRITGAISRYIENGILQAQRDFASEEYAKALPEVNKELAARGFPELLSSSTPDEIRAAIKEYNDAYEQLHQDNANATAAMSGATAGFTYFNARNNDYLKWNKAAFDASSGVLIESAEVLADTATISAPEVEDAPAIETGDSGGAASAPEATELEKAQSDYAAKLRQLAAQHEVGLSTASEYARAVDQLNLSTLAQLKASEDTTLAQSDFAKALEEAAANPLYGAEAQELEALNDVMRDYTAAMQEAANQREAGVIDEKEYWRSIASAARQAAMQAAAINPTTGALKDYLKALEEATGKLKEQMPEWQAKDRDSTFDYKKSKADILEEELSTARQNADSLGDYIRDLGADATESLIEQLEEAKAKASEIEEALKLQKIQDDLKDAFKDSFNDLDGMIDGIDGVVSAFENLNDTLSDADASAWDKFKAGWDVFTSITSAIKDTISMIQSIQQVMAVFTAFQKTQEMSAAATSVAASQTKAAAAETETVANTTAAASGAAAAHASIPFVGLALAAAAVAGMIALIITSKNKAKSFATGGIVSGATATGDKIQANLNAGEMVLNQRQQRNLFALLNGRGAGGASGDSGGNSTARIRGEDLYVALKNYTRRTGKNL